MTRPGASGGAMDPNAINLRVRKAREDCIGFVLVWFTNARFGASIMCLTKASRHLYFKRVGGWQATCLIGNGIDNFGPADFGLF